MNYKPILIVSGEPNSVFLEILIKSIKIKKIKSPIILICSKKLLYLQIKTLDFKITINEIEIKDALKLKIDKKKINLIDVKLKVNKAFTKISSKSNHYIENCFKVALKLLNYKITNTQDIYNVGCDELNGTINEVAQLIEKNIPGSEITLSSENIDPRNYAVSFKKYKDIFPKEKFLTVLDSINEFTNLFDKNKINFKNSIYSNLLTTKSFINDKKSELKDINNFLYEFEKVRYGNKSELAELKKQYLSLKKQFKNNKRD